MPNSDPKLAALAGTLSRVSEYQRVLNAYRALIADLEARARSLRESFAVEPEGNRREADRLDEEARRLRRALPALMRARFGEFDDDDEEPT